MTPEARIAKAAYNRKRYAADPTKDRAKNKRWYDANPGKVQAGKRRTLHGLEPEQYDVMFARQGGACAICKRPETVLRAGRVKALAVDHDHITGEVRGLLCHRCNRGLGLFGDSVEILRAATVYRAGEMSI